MKIELTLKDLILFVTYYSSDYGRAGSCLVTRLHKVLFIIKMLFKRLLKNIPEPEPGPYGPYFKDVSNELNELVSEGLVEVHEIERYRESDKDTGIIKYIILTDKGMFKVKEMISKLQEIEEGFRLLNDIRKYASMRLWDLIALIYFLYPEYTEKSRIKDRVRVYKYA